MIPKPPFPPPELLRKKGEGVYSIAYREGGRLVFSARSMPALPQRFVLVLAGSIVLEGQPIRCSGFTPEVTLRLQLAQRPRPPHNVDQERIVLEAWTQTYPVLARWLAASDGEPTLTVEAAGVKAQFARDALCQLRPGVMQIDLLHDHRRMA